MNEMQTWLSVGQVRRQLDVSAVQVYRLVASGRLTAVQTALGLLFDPASVERYAGERKPWRRTA